MAHRRDSYGPDGGGRHRWVDEPATGPVLMGRRHDDDQDGVPNYLDPDSPEYEGEPVAEHDEMGGPLVARGVARGVAGGLTAETLREAMGASLPLARYQQLLPAFTSALAQAGCTTVNRAAMFCAQIGHESVGLKYARELWGPSAQQKRYEPGTSLAKQLGNTRPGDGYRYRGAGWIQTTGAANFASVSKWAHARGYVPSPTYFVDRPDELGSDRYVWVGPVWYWTVARPTLGAQAEAGALEACTRLINGGLTGIDDRRDRWNRCLRLGARLLPGASPAPAPRAPGGIESMAFTDGFTDWAGNKQTVASWMNHVDKRLFELSRALVENSIPSQVDGQRRAAGTVLGETHDDVRVRLTVLEQKLDRLLAALPK